MIIDLPVQFSMKGNTKKDYAIVKDGILHIYGDISIRRMMYIITYELKDKNECFYCKKKIKFKHFTLDHMYAQDCGGPTIPNNLVPCCDCCNSEKSSMNTQEYIKYRNMSEKDSSEYRKLVEITQELAKKNGIFDLPLEWVSNMSTDKLIMKISVDVKKSKRYKKQAKHFKKYNHFAKPVVVDKNGFVLDGDCEVIFAVKNDIREVPVIILENVVMHI